MYNYERSYSFESPYISNKSIAKNEKKNNQVILILILTLLIIAAEIKIMLFLLQ